MGDLTQYFNRREVACQCGCGAAMVDMRFMDRLDRARGVAGVPFVVRSGLRCPTHNAKIGGKANSAHLRGLAADIATPDSRTRYHVLRAAFAVGFQRIGIGRDFIHLDTDPSLPQDVVFDYA